MLARFLRVLAVSMSVLAFGWAAPALGLQDHPDSQQDLSTLSLEDLTHIDVSSVARKSQALFRTPAAVFVITREDIRASGASSLPKLFRMVPRMEVAQISANTWGISARGFNSRYADKILVLIDGRSIYSMIYSGVFWDQNDLPLEDIDRIEVIRGPGGTLWGANAVNGVINIITRSAKETLGTKATAITGNRLIGATIRHGAEIGAKFQHRGFAKFLRRNALRADDRTSANDAGESFSVGGRGDLQSTMNDRVTFQGTFFRGAESQSVINFNPISGANHLPDSDRDLHLFESLPPQNGLPTEVRSQIPRSAFLKAVWSF